MGPRSVWMTSRKENVLHLPGFELCIVQKIASLVYRLSYPIIVRCNIPVGVSKSQIHVLGQFIRGLMVQPKHVALNNLIEASFVCE